MSENKLMCIKYDGEYVIYAEGVEEFIDIVNSFIELDIEFESFEVTERMWCIEWFDYIDEVWTDMWFTDAEEYEQYLSEVISAEVEYRVKIYN